MQENDGEQKKSRKIYADVRRRTRPSHTGVGDTVLVKQRKQTNFLPTFRQSHVQLFASGNPKSLHTMVPCISHEVHVIFCKRLRKERRVKAMKSLLIMMSKC